MAERFIVEGGRRLEGTIKPGGNKNAALPILAACLLTDEPVILRNLPDIQDVRVMLQILEGIGTSVNRLLRNHGLTLATFEIATAGKLSAILTDGDSDSAYRGGIVLARESDLLSFCRGTGIPVIEKIGDPRALQALAVQAKEAFYADVGLVLCAMDREAGTSRGGMITFPVAVETPWGFRHDEAQVRTTTPAETRHRMTLAAIAFLREVLQSQTYLA